MEDEEDFCSEAYEKAAQRLLGGNEAPGTKAEAIGVALVLSHLAVAAAIREAAGDVIDAIEELLDNDEDDEDEDEN